MVEKIYRNGRQSSAAFLSARLREKAYRAAVQFRVFRSEIWFVAQNFFAITDFYISLILRGFLENDAGLSSWFRLFYG